MKRDLAKLILLGGVAWVTVPAAAQQVQPETATSVDQGAIPDIVVTAQKRSESVQSVPLAITAISGDSLAQRNISDVTGLAASVPNMTFGSFGGAAHIAIRGVGLDDIGQGQEGRIAYHLDGIYIAQPSDVLGTFYDVERVEVLRGPQGTLYGRNATGGSINVVTRGATDRWEGYLRVGYGNYNALTSEGAVGGPIAQGVSFRVAYTVENRDGFGKNLTTGSDIDNARRRGARGTLSFDLGASGKLDLSADYYRERDANYGYHNFGQANPAIPASGLALGGFIPSNFRDTADNFDPINDREAYGFAARAQIDLGGGATLKSITAYRRSHYRLRAGGDGTSASLAITSYFDRARQFSQEFQLSGTIGRLKYIVGAYYLDKRTFGGTDLPFSLALVGLPNVFVQGYHPSGVLKTEAAAGFGQLDYDITEHLTLTVGGRYGWEKHQVDDKVAFDLATPYPPENYVAAPLFRPGGNSTSDTSFTPKVQIAYKPQKDMMFYASVSKGYKSGGYNVGTTTAAGDGAPAFKPETIWAYEGGMKSTFADGRVRINAAGFYYDYTNLQVSKVLFNTVQTLNAASAIVYGAEAEITVIPANGLQLDAAPAWLHTEYKDFSTANPSNPFNPAEVSLDGNQLTQAPKKSIRFGAQYSWPIADGKMTLRGEMNYQSRIYFTPFNEKQVSREPNTKFNAFLNYEGDHWNASLYVINLTDKTTIANALAAGILFGAPVLGTLEPPRTYGVKVDYHF